MFVEKAQRRFRQFDLSDQEDAMEYDELLKDPSCRVLKCDKQTLTSTNIERMEGSQSVQTETKIVFLVEWEDLGL